MGPEEAPALPVLLGDTEVVVNTEALRVQHAQGTAACVKRAGRSELISYQISPWIHGGLVEGRGGSR